MLTEKEKQLLELHQGNKKLNKWIDSISNSNNPFFLKESAELYNWDDGFKLPLAIANNKYCDKGVALTLFWLAEGIIFFSDEIKKNEYNIDWANFCELIGNRLINDIYDEGPVSFNPLINRVSIYKYEKSGIPKELYYPVEGNI